MGDTFKFWLTANFGIILTIIVFPISALVLYTGDAIEQSGGNYWEYLAAVAAFALFVAFPGKKVVDSFSIYLLLLFFGLAGLFALTCIEHDVPDNITIDIVLKSGYFIFGCVCLVVSWVVSGLLMPFVSANIDEIVSRSMRFRNSNVDLFEFKWKYLIALFLDISRAIFGNVAMLVFIIKLS